MRCFSSVLIWGLSYFASSQLAEILPLLSLHAQLWRFVGMLSSGGISWGCLVPLNDTTGSMGLITNVLLPFTIWLVSIGKDPLCPHLYFCYQFAWGKCQSEIETGSSLDYPWLLPRDVFSMLFLSCIMLACFTGRDHRTKGLHGAKHTPGMQMDSWQQSSAQWVGSNQFFFFWRKRKEEVSLWVPKRSVLETCIDHSPMRWGAELGKNWGELGKTK